MLLRNEGRRHGGILGCEVVTIRIGVLRGYGALPLFVSIEENIVSCSVRAVVELGPEDEDRDRRLVVNDAVAERVELIGIGIVDTQCDGSPIIQATNCGFRRISPSPMGAPEIDDFRDVGSIGIPVRAIVDKLAVPALGLSNAPPLPLIPFWLEPYSDAVGVGSEHEETIAEVRGTDGCSWNTVPACRPPDRCQIPEDFLESTSTVNAEETGDVFDEDPRRFDFARDAPDFGPEPSSVLNAETFSCDAGALTRKTGNDDIHSAAIRFASEGFQIVEHRTCIQVAFDHSTSDDGSRIGLPLDNTHKLNSWESESGCTFEPSVSRAERKYSSGMNRYMIHVSMHVVYGVIRAG